MRIRPPYPILQVAVQAVGGLHPSAECRGGLLESWRLSRFVSILLFSPQASHRPPIVLDRRQIGTKADVAELTTSFSLLLNMLRGHCKVLVRVRPRSVGVWSLGGSVDSCHLHILAGRD